MSGSRCEVCGLQCGTLRGRAKSWPCAGKLAHRSRTGESQKIRDDLRARFGSDEKQQARELLRDDLLALPSGAAVLDLYGGGLSAEWMMNLRPDIDLTIAETSRKLWPALRLDAARLNAHAHCGSFETIALKRFDLIWLDLCGEPVTVFHAVRTGVYLLRELPRYSQFLAMQFRPSNQPSVMYVTLMNQDRNGRPELKPEIRHIATQALLDTASGGLRSGIQGTAVHLIDYPQAGRKGRASLWRIGPSYVEQVRARAESDARRDEGREWHYDLAACAWQVERGERRYAGQKCWPHAQGTCRCVAKGYITGDEQREQGQTFAAFVNDSVRSRAA